MKTETAIERMQGDMYCSIYTSEKAFSKRIKELAKKYPTEVAITKSYKDGSLQATVPYEWFKLPTPPKTYNFTAEHKNKLKENIKKAREVKSALSSHQNNEQHSA